MFKNPRYIFIQIRDAISGKEQDYTKMGIRKSIFLLAIPMVLEMLMESFFALWDMFIVKELGDASVGVVGITETLMTLVYALGLGVGMGTTAFVARRIGEKKAKEASVGAAQAIILGIVLSLAFAIPGILYPEFILQKMNAEAEVIGIGQDYVRWMLGGNVVIMLLFINNAIFRSAGNPALAFIVLFVTNIINIILDPLLVFGIGPFPEMGVTGAAVATNIGRGIGVILQFILLIKGSGKINIFGHYFIPKIKVLWRIMVLSGGGIFQFIIATSSWLLLYRILANFGTEVIAGYTIAIRVFIFFLLPAWGLSNAASTLVGQNLGANNPLRAQQSAAQTALWNAAYMFVVFLFFQLFTDEIVSVFRTSDAAFEIAKTSLRIVSYGIVLYGVGMVMTQSINGAGDTYTPTLINFIGFWVVEIPLAWYLSSHTSLLEEGVFWSVCVAESLIALLGVYFFRRGKWKLRKV